MVDQVLVEGVAQMLGLLMDLAETAKSARVRAGSRRSVLGHLWLLAYDAQRVPPAPPTPGTLGTECARAVVVAIRAKAVPFLQRDAQTHPKRRRRA